jgi:teichuronic acid biosynthesis glycosyltransferase TuaH
MLENADIVVVGLQPWDISIGSNCRNIALELSRNNRVLYVNPPLDRSTFLRHGSDPSIEKRIAIIKKMEPGLIQVSETLYTLYPSMIAESINWIQWKPAFDWLNRLNNKRLASDIKKALNVLEFNDYILFNDQSMIRCYHMKEMLKPNSFIYYIRDNLSTIPYFKRYGMKMQADLIEQADAVATNSQYLAEYARKYNVNSEMVGQGCDFTLYNNPEEITMAEELQSIRSSGPVVGYTGYLTSLRLDIDLLEHVALKMPQCQFVFVGPEDESFRKSMLHNMRNVHFMGNKDPEMLPQYIKGFDVAINPQLVNEITMGNYPRKIDEYLAMGKPVVATSTPFMAYFKEHTYLCSTVDEYIMMIQQAIAENSEARVIGRRKFALQHTWENNVTAIGQLLQKAKKFSDN